MEEVEFTHVSVIAIDLQLSIDWYTDLFGADVVVTLPSPRFIGPAAWLKMGHLSLHLAQSSEPSLTTVNHFGIGVLKADLFHSIYRKAEERGLFDRRLGSNIFEIPSGEVQMYLLDPGNNLVEVDFPDGKLLDPDVIKDIPKLAETFSPQPDGAAEGRLFRWLHQERV
jgi:lactoylglutathione lyase